MKKTISLLISAIVFAMIVGLFVIFLSKQSRVGTDTGAAPKKASQSFDDLMSAGRNYYEKNQTDQAIAAFEKGVLLEPTHPEARLNLANAFLLSGDPTNAARQAQEALALTYNSPAAHYVLGCANLRLAKFEDALKELQIAHDIDPTVAAVNFQLGRTHFELGHMTEAITAFEATIQLETNHPSAHYSLSQALTRAGQNSEAQQELARHQEIISRLTTPPTAATYERCTYTAARAAFTVERPAQPGMQVRFTDATKDVFPGGAQNFSGPVGVIDFNHDGRYSLFVCETNAFRLLENKSGKLQPRAEQFPAIPGAKYSRCLVGDLQNDGFEDVIVLGRDGTHVFQFQTNGAASEITGATGIKNLKATAGALADLDFTGKLDLFAVTPDGGVQVFRNLGNFYFVNRTATSGIPVTVSNAREIHVADWNNDDMMDLLIARDGQPPLWLEKLRGATLSATNPPADWPAGHVIASGDLNNDLRADLVIATTGRLEVVFGGTERHANLPADSTKIRQLALVDYDNDGWLDIVAVGTGLRVWRNLGDGNFRETTDELGLKSLATTEIDSIATADFDRDGDTDFILALARGGLIFLRNDGGNQNHLLTLRPEGNRSNKSGLGIKVEASAGGLRLIRTVEKLPVEIGLGKHTQLDTLTLHWFDLQTPAADVKIESAPFSFAEWILPTGSCPYLYAWDGRRFRFVTDILGAAPAGLHLSDDRLIDADPEEFIWLGNEQQFKPRKDNYVLQVTEELREALYLDEAKLVAVDHPAGTVVRTTSKLRSGKPFPRPAIVTLVNPRPLIRATLASEPSTRGGAATETDVTDLLKLADEKFVSPIQLRIPQLRGLAEPFVVTLDFGPLETEKPLVLALTGWLRFGGGMANVAGSHHPDLPFPFPTLSVETAGGTWLPVKADVGAPAGKTKTILVDLHGLLPPGARRLRISTAFEIHWDCAELFELSPEPPRVVTLSASASNLHWRGFSNFENRDWTHPLTPAYDVVHQQAYWRITPSGWCTRYGDVAPLVAEKDNAVMIMNGGDELTLNFAATPLPPVAPGMQRDFFFYAVGWDKDADFHVERGWTIEPIPWHGMNDQGYGREPRPLMANDGWIKLYNTRWVGPLTLERQHH
jgi:Flp pilus assembly protein TadD